MTNVKTTLTSDQLSSVREDVFSGILTGDILFNKDTNDHKALHRYVNGMVDNHFRKAKELNGGVRYVPTNSGKGQRDLQLSSLKRLIKQYSEGSDEFNSVTGAIATRELELTQEKKVAAATRKREDAIGNIDMSVLPEDLQEALTQGD